MRWLDIVSDMSSAMPHSKRIEVPGLPKATKVSSLDIRQVALTYMSVGLIGCLSVSSLVVAR